MVVAASRPARRSLVRVVRMTVGSVALAAGLTACPPSGSTGPGTPAGDFDRAPLLQSVGEHVVLPTLRQFATESTALHAASGEWVSALGAGNAGDKREAAREAWRTAMRAWQQAEVMQVGPAAPPERATGGRALRDEIYAWPTVNPCAIDQALVANTFENAGHFDGALVNTYGLAALEYVLFHDVPGNSCPPQITPNSDGKWAALGAEEITARRARYAQAASAYLVKRAEELRDAWEPSGGNYLAQFAELGRMGTDEVFAGMFYLDLVVKDAKLAVPAGLDTACMAETCPQALESRWGGHSKENLIENVRGFRRMLLGNAEGEEARVGFDDWLAHRGAPEVTEALLADLAAAEAKLEAIADMRAALVSDPERVREVHADVKRVTDLLKSQFVTVLGLRIPAEGAADND